jgi:dTDP-4-dehydrorhamnose 3,5-epimerase
MQVKSLEGVEIFSNTLLEDARGRTLKISSSVKDIFTANKALQVFVSSNKERGTFRGLHYQVDPFPETKLITCISGQIHDILVDIRPESSTYLNWMVLELAADSSVLVPPYIAHGYQTLQIETVVHYVIDGIFSEAASRTLNILDPKLDIELPLPISQISSKDASAKNLL